MIDSLNAVLLVKILQRHQASIVAGTTVVAIHAVKESDVVEMRAPSTCCYLVGSHNPPRRVTPTPVFSTVRKRMR